MASIEVQSWPASWPIRDADGSLRVETPATPAILTAYKTRRYFSVEFHSLAEVRTAGGIREIRRALLEAAALVPNPEYPNVRARSASGAPESSGCDRTRDRARVDAACRGPRVVHRHGDRTPVSHECWRG